MNALAMRLVLLERNTLTVGFQGNYEVYNDFRSIIAYTVRIGTLVRSPQL
jgi:hypothetical protein